MGWEGRVYARIKLDSGEIEDVRHWLVQCSAWNCLKQTLLEAMEAEMDDGKE